MVNKVSINLLCGLIIAVLGASVLVPSFSFCKAFMIGFNDGINSTVNENIIHKTAVPVTLTDTDLQIRMLTKPEHEIEFDNGRSLDFVGTQGFILINENEIPNWSIAVQLLCTATNIVLMILLVIEIVKFMININRGLFFVKDNVKRLQRFSIYLLCMALMEIILAVSYYLLIDSLSLSINGVSFALTWNFPWTSLLLGMISLLIAKIWQRGIEMEQEQELTI